MSENFSQYKELLKNLFKESFEDKLKNLEKKSKNHLLVISSTKEITKNITSMSINIRNQILKKIKKETSVNKLKKKNTFKKVYSPKSSNLKTSSGLKTPLKSIKKIIRKTEIKTVGNFKKKDSRVVNKSINKEIYKTNNEKSKTFRNNNNMKKYKNDIKLENDKKNKTVMYSFSYKNSKSCINKAYTKRHSLGNLKYKSKEKEKNNKDNKSELNRNEKNNNKTFIKNNNKNNSIFNKVLRNIENKRRSFSVHKKLNKTFERKRSKTVKENSSFSIQTLEKLNKKINEKNKSYKKEKEFKKINENKNIIKLTFMESNLQADNPFFLDDSLLITPLNDCDFNQHELIFKQKELKEIKIRKNIIDYLSNKNIKNIEKIFEFLSKKELIQLRSVSKYFNQNILNYFLRYLDETKNNLVKMKNNPRVKLKLKNFNNFEYSQSSKRANIFLNENNMYEFFEAKTPPNNDILFIFEVFFQLINNPISNLYYNRVEFWNNCRFYFLNESKGKIGNLLNDIIINNKIDTSEDNLYQLYELVKNKLHIILPSYFNEISSIMFFISYSIKDILNFLGISTEIKVINENGYSTYSKIIKSIDKKIDMIIKYK